jgi:hypothetical protein
MVSGKVFDHPVNQTFFIGATETRNLCFADDHDSLQNETTAGCGIQTRAGV